MTQSATKNRSAFDTLFLEEPWISELWAPTTSFFPRHGNWGEQKPYL